jgi:hypothetical protein
MFGLTVDLRRLCLAGLAAVLLAVVAAPTTARADSSMGGSAAVRLVDMSSDAQAADFYLDGARAWSGVSYKTVSNYIDVGAGNHVYEVRKAGSAGGSPPLAKGEEMLKPGGYYSVMTAGPSEGMKASVFDDGSSTMPTPDVCQARFINATSDLTIDVTVRGLDTNFSNLGSMQASPYGQLPKGVYDVEIKDGTSGKVLAMVRNYVAPGGHMHSLAATGGMGRPVELVEFYDAMTADAVPEGAAHTGAGGGQPTNRAAVGYLPRVPSAFPLALLGAAVLLTGLPRLKL